MKEAFGCIDGTHIPIQCPNQNSKDYLSYKHFYSINVQAVCDGRGYFMDMDCMWPGSVHDEKGKIPCYLLGDPAYPPTSFSMKE